MKKIRFSFIMLIVFLSMQVPVNADNPAKTAQEIINISGIKAGLCVQLGCTDEKLLEAFSRTGTFLVHGISGNAAKLREQLVKKNLAGTAGAEHLAFNPLPYSDNTINLIVAEDMSGLVKKGLKPAEIVRVLCPNGIACLGISAAQQNELKKKFEKAGVADVRIDKKSRVWLVVKKPRPTEMDEWTHWNHGPDGNMVSQDLLIERPNQVQWIAGPQWWGHAGRYTIPVASGQPLSMVTAGGRNFYIVGAGGFAKEGYQIVARDAFNGILLWSRNAGGHDFSDLAIAKNETAVVKDGKKTVIKGLHHFRLIAVGNEVYLWDNGEIIALDAATGNIIRSYGKAPFGCYRFQRQRSCICL
jgi:hypothetical protein